jgi:hypothetical protein
MVYDCSVTNRKGCNYCLRRKNLINDDSDTTIFINDNDCNGNAYLDIRDIIEEYYYDKKISVNYCPICGKKLK